MSNTYLSVKTYINSMSQGDIRGFDFYPMPNEPIEHFRASFLDWLKRKSLIGWFFENRNLKKTNAE